MPQTLQQFGQTIKQKHPEYGDLPDEEVAQKVLAKYPQYQDMVKQPTGKEQRLALASPGANTFTPTPESNGYADTSGPTGFLKARANQLNASLDRQQQGQQGPLQTGIQFAGNTVVGPAMDVVGKMLSPVTKTSDFILNQGAGRVANVLSGKGFTPNQPADPLQYISNPAYRDTAEGVLNLGQAAASVAGSAKAGPEVQAGLKQIPEAVDEAATKRYTAQTQAEWTKPTTVAKPAYNKATQIFKSAADNGHNIADTLLKNKLRASDYIDNGAYNTADVAEKMRADTGQLSADMLRPALQQADATVPKIPVADVVAKAKANINAQKSLTYENKLSLIKNLEATQAALEQQYPKGMSLTNLHDEKIVRDMNAKYNPLGDIASNNEAIKNKAVADAARKTLEAKAPKDIPVHDFNAELKKQYQAADYLDALHNKKAPVSLGSKIAKTAAKVAGAAVGNTLGGGVLGGVGGYHIGGMVESLFENMPNPVKNYYLNKLETTNPAAFNQVQSFLNTKPAPKKLLK